MSSPRTWGTGPGCLAEPQARRGSSPRTWGTDTGPRHRCRGRDRHRGRWRARPRWFIPTHVGNRRQKLGTDAQSAGHPHVRGEQTSSVRPNIRRAGSSPRMWGTDCRTQSFTTVRQIIPTHVGNRPVGKCRYNSSIADSSKTRVATVPPRPGSECHDTSQVASRRSDGEKVNKRTDVDGRGGPLRGLSRHNWRSRPLRRRPPSSRHPRRCPPRRPGRRRPRRAGQAPPGRRRPAAAPSSRGVTS